MSSIYTSDDPAFMTPGQLHRRHVQEQNHQLAIENTARGILNDDEQMKALIFDQVQDIWATLASLAREYDADTAHSLHKQLRGMVMSAAIRETNPPESGD